MRTQEHTSQHASHKGTAQEILTEQNRNAKCITMMPMDDGRMDGVAESTSVSRFVT